MVNPNFNGQQQDVDDGGTVVIGFKPHTKIGYPAISWSSYGDNFAFRDLRNDVFTMHAQRFDNLDEKIRQYKMHALNEMGLLGSNSSNSSDNNTIIDDDTATADKWKLIGFARRKSR